MDYLLGKVQMAAQYGISDGCWAQTDEKLRCYSQDPSSDRCEAKDSMHHPGCACLITSRTTGPRGGALVSHRKYQNAAMAFLGR